MRCWLPPRPGPAPGCRRVTSRTSGMPLSSSCPYRASRGARTSRGGAPQACQVTGRDGGRCPNQAEVKLADSLGDSVWACLPHAEDILVTVPAAFIASHDDRGIAVFLVGH